MYGVYGSVTDSRAVMELFDTSPVYDERGIWRMTRKQLFWRGVLIDSTQAALKTKIETLLAGVSDNNANAGFYHDDGTVSPWFLETSSALGGVRIIHRVFPNLDDPGVYATGIPYRIGFEALYPAVTASPMIFRETIRYIGNCGPRRAWAELPTGSPTSEIVNQSTLQFIVQDGTALALLGVPLHSDPAFPNYENVDRRSIKFIGTESAGANLAQIHAGVEWHYEFTCPTPQFALPNFR